MLSQQLPQPDFFFICILFEASGPALKPAGEDNKDQQAGGHRTQNQLCSRSLLFIIVFLEDKYYEGRDNVCLFTALSLSSNWHIQGGQ